MKAKELMTKNVVCIPKDYAMRHAHAVMLRMRVRHLPVVEKGRLLGIVSDRDLLPFTKNGELLSDATVEGIMSSRLITREPKTSVAHLAEIMIEHKIDSVPIVSGNEFVGLVTSSDLLSLLLAPLPTVQDPFPFRFNLFTPDSGFATA